MLMSINHWKTIESFKAYGKEKVVEGFDTLKLSDAWTKYFWAYYCQLDILPSLSNFSFHFWYKMEYKLFQT
jgi:hypothetical protein